MLPHKYALIPVLTGIFLLINLSPAHAAPESPLIETYADREMITYIPSRLPAEGTRSLVVVLHGGMGNAERIVSAQSEHGLNMNTAAEQDGFIVVYLNGTPATRFMGTDKHAWNAGGGCCGQPALKNIDDVSYIRGAIQQLVARYGIDPHRVYGMGHSNGAMMTLRLICQTDLYAAAVSVSGPLNLPTRSCPGAQGRRILAIHGALDQNVPIEGGRGTKGIAEATFSSEDTSQEIFRNSGASYDLDILKEADHNLDHINKAIQTTEGQTLAEKAARFFGLAGAP